MIDFNIALLSVSDNLDFNKEDITFNILLVDFDSDFLSSVFAEFMMSDVINSIDMHEVLQKENNNSVSDIDCFIDNGFIDCHGHTDDDGFIDCHGYNPDDYVTSVPNRYNVSSDLLADNASDCSNPVDDCTADPAQDPETLTHTVLDSTVDTDSVNTDGNDE